MHKSYCRVPLGNHLVTAPIYLILIAIFSHIEQQQLPKALSQQNLMSLCWTTTLACCWVVCVEEWPERTRSLFLKITSVVASRDNDVVCNQASIQRWVRLTIESKQSSSSHDWRGLSNFHLFVQASVKLQPWLTQRTGRKVEDSSRQRAVLPRLFCVSMSTNASWECPTFCLAA